MRILAALVCLSVLLALTAATASAAERLDARRVLESRQEVVRYWSDERMRNATPIEQARGAAEGALQAAFPFRSYDHAAPYPPEHGKVFFTLGGADYQCSGTALDSANRSVVWTAGHCVNEGPGAFATNWAFVPAYRDGSAPYGIWTARALVTTAPWAEQGNFGYDLGAAVVGTSGFGALNDVVGGRGVAFNYDRNQTYSSYGYPAAPPFNGQRLHVCESQLARSDSSTSPPTMGIGCDMTGGSSGGGWVVGDSVYSVNSYGYLTQPNMMYGPYQGAVAQALYGDASSR
jgi:hypothetical protein